MTESPSSEFDRPVSRRTAAIWGAALKSLTLILLIARNIALIPLYLHFIGTEEYGAWIATGSVLIQMTSIDFGLLGVLGQRVAAAYGQKDRQRLETLVGSGVITGIGIAAVLAAISVSAAPFVPRLVGLDGQAAWRLSVCFAIVALGNALQVISFGLGGVLESLQRTVVPGVQQIVGELLSLGLTAWLVVEGWGLYGIAIGGLARSVWSTGGNAVGCHLLLRRKMGLRPRWDSAVVRDLWRSSVYVFSTQIAARVKTNLDPFLVGAMLGPHAALTYALTTRPHDTIRTFALVAEGALTPGLAHLHGQGDEARFRRLILLLYRVQLVAGAIGFGAVFALNPAFVRLWIGEPLYAGTSVNLLAALAGVTFLVTAVSYDATFARGNFPLLNRVVWIEMALRVPLVLLFLYFLRPNGLWVVPAMSIVSQLAAQTYPLTRSAMRAMRVSRTEARTLGVRMARQIVPLVLLSTLFVFVARGAASWPELIVFGAVYVVLAAAVAAMADRELLDGLRA